MATNFESITESPEKLAEFLDEITHRCNMGYESCVYCPIPCYSKERIIEWLQEEASE